MYDYHIDGTLPESGEWILVFGSNMRGAHGAGAARVAKELFGAQTGVWSGLTGLSYAIPTKDSRLQTLPVETIRRYIDEFVRFTHERPEFRFWVTRVGCGLAGYRDEQIAPLFRGCNSNCSFAEEWRFFLE